MSGKAKPGGIDNLLNENRVFETQDEFQKNAHINSLEDYERIWDFAKDHPDEFYRQQADKFISWEKGFDSVLDWQLPHAKWFGGGQLNVAANCLDRHLEDRGDKKAIIWEGESGEVIELTYSQLHQEVCKFSNALTKLGIKPGDRIAIYMPMIPEMAVAVLACARLGAVHNVIFGGFSAEALSDRCNDSSAKLLITADGGWRRAQIVALKDQVDRALETTHTVQNVVVVKRTAHKINMKPERDLWWHDLIKDSSSAHTFQPFDSEHPLFILYTSGSTGKPKGLLHTSAGYLLGAAMTCHYVFDLKEDDVYWCTADIGWITGHSYVIYGPLANGATIMMYEGAPTTPAPDRFWQIVAKHKVSIFYTAPTAIRAFIKAGDQWPKKHDLSSLRLLGTVGEPINPEAWTWYREVIGGNRCPIVDTWWQTETGSMMISPMPGCTPTMPGSATKPFFGIVPAIVDKAGEEQPPGQGGYLVIKRPWPSMARTIYGDDPRYLETYWNQVPGVYFTGDGARQDEDGNFWIMGRIDDVINVSGHRLGTMEVESALVSHDAVAEAAVVSRPHDVKGECIVCFVTPKSGVTINTELKTELCTHVVASIGALARPEEIKFAESLPKTRSGKIMRRLLRDIARGNTSMGDMTTLEDFSVLASLRSDSEE
jgi:acetyl-CoA synthetase